jgi:K+/H+ antiporter YhaU regulatory subunit KhtT
LPILKTSKHLTVVAAVKKSSDLVVVAEERHEKLCASVLKDESEIAVAAAFEELDS